MTATSAATAPGEGEPLRWTDNHCHLPEEADQAFRWVADARDAGVSRFIDVGCDLPTSLKSVASATRFDGVWATAGIHPHDAKTVVAADTGAIDLSSIEALLAHDSVVAVGECGLDYHYDHSPREQQREVFAAQIALAFRHDLALVIHTREAWDDTFAILDVEGVPPRTVFHCFTGGPDEARRGLDLGIHLSFSGIVTYKNAPELREAAALCPIDMLLVETDSPYLAPVPHRGKKNQPAFVSIVGEAVAAAKDLPVAEVAAATWANAERLYALR
jgi:TatD DNase family protein